MQHLGSGNTGSVMTWSTMDQERMSRSSHGARWDREHWVSYHIEPVGSGKIGLVMTWSTLGQRTLGRSSYAACWIGKIGLVITGAHWVRNHWVGHDMEQVGSENIGSVMTGSTLDQGHWVGHDMEHVGSENIGSVMTWSTLCQRTLGRS